MFYSRPGTNKNTSDSASMNPTIHIVAFPINPVIKSATPTRFVTKLAAAILTRLVSLMFKNANIHTTTRILQPTTPPDKAFTAVNISTVLFAAERLVRLKEVIRLSSGSR